jgi:hypothetical protein
MPGVSVDALKRMRKEVRGWRIHRRTTATLAALAKQYNPVLRGWWNYFGEFYPSAMHSFAMYLDDKLMQWARRKYQTLERRKQASVEWLIKMKRSDLQGGKTGARKNGACRSRPPNRFLTSSRFSGLWRCGLSLPASVPAWLSPSRRTPA